MSRILSLYVVIFFAFLGYSLMITIFTPMLLHPQESTIAIGSSLAVRAILLGILLCLYPLGQFFGSPILGALSDYLGRKPVLILSLIFTTFFYGWISLALVFRSLPFLMIGTFLAGLCESNVTIAQSSIADVTEKKQRSRFFGYIYLSVSLAYIAGPLFGGRIAEYFDYSTPFWWVFLLLAAITIWIAIGFKETFIPERKKPKIRYFDTLTNLKYVFTEKKIRMLYLANFLIYLAIFGFFRAYPMYIVDEFSFGVGKLSQYIAWVAVPIIFVNLYFLGLAARKWNPKQLLVGSSICAGALILLVILPSNPNALWITLFLVAGAIAFCLPSCPMVLSTAVSEQVQGKTLGNNQALQFAAESLSGLLAGFLASVFIRLPMIILAILAVIGGLILLFSKIDGKKTH